MRAALDGAASIMAAIATLIICGLPCWFTYQAILSGAAPVWAYGSVVVLGAIGVILTLAFLRKGFRGISPSRTRRR